MVPEPSGNCAPFTASVAVAVPAEPVNTAVPNEVPLIENETDPEGVVPPVDVTVTVTYATSFEDTVVRLLSNVMLVVGFDVLTVAPFHPVTSL
jgi:hypothetical protein